MRDGFEIGALFSGAFCFSWFTDYGSVSLIFNKLLVVQPLFQRQDCCPGIPCVFVFGNRPGKSFNCQKEAESGVDSALEFSVFFFVKLQPRLGSC